MNNALFRDAVAKRYMVGATSLLKDEDIDAQLESIDD